MWRLPFDPLQATCLVKFLKIVMFVAQLKHLNWFCLFVFAVIFSTLIIGLHNMPTVENIYKRPIVGHGSCRQAKSNFWCWSKTISCECRFAGCQPSKKTSKLVLLDCHLFQRHTWQLVKEKHKWIQCKLCKQWCHEIAVPTVDRAHFQAIFSSKLFVMSHAIFTIFVVWNEQA